MNYIVLDLEWNQPYDKKSMVKTPVALHGEIIQIGAIKLDENYHIIDTFEIMVAPKHYRKILKKVSKLTKITNEDLKRGLKFPDAFEYFKKWCGEDFIFLTWGEDDIGILNSNIVLHKLDNAWVPSTYNIQVIFDSQITREKRQVSLSYAMEKIGESALEAHDAWNDAMNTVCVCKYLDMEKGLEEYEEIKKQINHRRRLSMDYSESTRTYATREEAFSDPMMTQFCCPKCGGAVTCNDIIKQNGDKFIAICKCESGDELFVRFKLIRRDDGRLGVKRIIYEMDDDKRNLYMEKKNK
ncbi:MAG: exonuclease domain-containing protein [Lachnospiraceae bacterium]|nr:exonuclease domain-containing protein [Lachnospiraceae bacterium]